MCVCGCWWCAGVEVGVPDGSDAGGDDAGEGGGVGGGGTGEGVEEDGDEGCGGLFDVSHDVEVEDGSDGGAFEGEEVE